MSVRGVNSPSGNDLYSGLADVATPNIVNLPDTVAAVLRRKPFRYIVVENDATPALVGIVANQLSTPSYVSPTNTTLRTSLNRINTTNNSANVQVGNNFTDPPCSRFGGFFVCHCFSAVVLNADAVVSIGLNNAPIVLGNDPSATGNRIVLGADTADANLSWISVDGTPTATKSAAVISKAAIVAGPDVFEVRMWALPNDSKITCQLYNVSTDTVVNQSDITATLPAMTSNLRPTQILCSKTNGTPATSADFFYWYAYY